MITKPATQLLSVRYGRPNTQVASGAGGLIVDLAITHLGGPAEEGIGSCMGAGAAVVEQEEGGYFLSSGDGICGVLITPCRSEDLEAAAEDIYRQLLRKTEGFSIYRIWNYVSNINLVHDGLENYHRFNRGRWRAFANQVGDAVAGKVPAASAVGIDDAVLATIFQAGIAPVEYVENPQQIPAWNYPEQYGPKSPSFSRGAWVRHEDGRNSRFFSGTASIRGHETVAIGDVAAQCRVTCENLRIVGEQMGVNNIFEAQWPWHSKIYLRRAADLPVVQQALASAGAGVLNERSTVVVSDICRSCLDVEIEITCDAEGDS